MSFQGFAEAYNVALDVPKDMGMKSVFLVIFVIVATACHAQGILYHEKIIQCMYVYLRL